MSELIGTQWGNFDPRTRELFVIPEQFKAFREMEEWEMDSVKVILRQLVGPGEVKVVVRHWVTL